MRWYFDTSVLVAATVSTHVHHARAKSALTALHEGKHRGCLSTHGLTELYSVLTGTPFKPTVHPIHALKAIEDQIIGHMTLVSLEADEYIAIIRRAASEGWIGGRIHDAVHLQCAARMKCDRVYTFNVRDFRALAPANLADKISMP